MKRLNLLWMLPPFVIFLFYACKETTPATEPVVEMNMDSVKMQISAMEAAYADASNRRDVDGIVAYYASDAQSYPPEEPALSGKDAITKRLRSVIESDTSKTTISLTTTGVWAAGNYATETGTWTDMDSTGKVIATGKFMTLFELRDGKYVAIRDIWNRDSPKTTPAPAQ